MKKTIMTLGLVLLSITFMGCGKTGKLLKQQEETNNRLKKVESILEQDESEEVANLKKEIKEKEKELSKNSMEQNVDNIYMELKFPRDGGFYKDSNESQFYITPNCLEEDKIYNVRFMSYGVDDAEAPNKAFWVRCALRDDGKVVYTTGNPLMITEEKYNELHKNDDKTN